MPSLQRTNPPQRLRDYEEALSFYLPLVGTTFDDIVFAENSASDITSLKQMVRSHGVDGPVQFLSFNGLDHPPAYGRGYGEFKLVDHAMNHSPALRDDAFVWKCTGRYKIRNIVDLVKIAPSGGGHLLSLQGLPARAVRAVPAVVQPSRLPVCHRRVLRSLRNDVVPGVHSNEEVAFRRLADSVSSDVNMVCRFNRTPLVEGKRGWDNSEYSGKWHPKIALRRAAGVLAPWVWI